MKKWRKIKKISLRKLLIWIMKAICFVSTFFFYIFLFFISANTKRQKRINGNMCTILHIFACFLSLFVQCTYSMHFHVFLFCTYFWNGKWKAFCDTAIVFTRTKKGTVKQGIGVWFRINPEYYTSIFRLKWWNYVNTGSRTILFYSARNWNCHHYSYIVQMNICDR